MNWQEHWNSVQLFQDKKIKWKNQLISFVNFRKSEREKENKKKLNGFLILTSQLYESHFSIYIFPPFSVEIRKS